MSYIIGSKCVGVCDAGCVDVCPVDCRGEEVHDMTEEQKKGLQLYIDPIECIDCGACVPECPVEAIYTDEESAIEDGELEFVKKNYEFYGKEFKNNLDN